MAEYSGTGDRGVRFISGLSLYFYGELISSALGLFICLISMYKMKWNDLKGYRGVFWASAFVGYAVLFAYGVRGIYLSRASRMYLQTFGVITIEFCFSIVNLALSSTHAIFEMRSPKTEWLWLLYSFSHIPLAMVICVLYEHLHDPEQLLFWNHIWLFLMQLTNVSAFFAHMYWIRLTVKKFTLSKTTAAILVNVLNRFIDFIVCYCIYMVSTCMLMTLVIIDVSGAWSEGALSALDAALYLYGTARFYTFLRAVYIFRPYWVRHIHSWNSSVFNSVTVRTGNGLDQRPSAINVDSSASFTAGLARRDSLNTQYNVNGLHGMSMNMRVEEEDMKDFVGNDELEMVAEVNVPSPPPPVRLSDSQGELRSAGKKQPLEEAPS